MILEINLNPKTTIAVLLLSLRPSNTFISLALSLSLSLSLSQRFQPLRTVLTAIDPKHLIFFEP